MDCVLGVSIGAHFMVMPLICESQESMCISIFLLKSEIKNEFIEFNVLFC